MGDDIQNILKGNLPEQHCQQLITERSDGEFVYEGEGSDSCLLPSATSFGFNPRGAGYTYHYKTCVEIELSAKINDEWAKPSQLSSLKGGEKVWMVANTPVTWEVSSEISLDVISETEWGYQFVMPVTSLIIFKAISKCDSEHTKSITCAVDNLVFKGFGEVVDGYIREAAKLVGVDEKYLRGVLKMEAGWTGKDSPTKAVGAGQMTRGTWSGIIKNLGGASFGMTAIDDGNFMTFNDPRRDLRINIIATALLTKDNTRILKNNKIEITPSNLYLMHNIGIGVVPALKGSNKVKSAVVEHMNSNGKKSNETPTQFVKRQGDKFMDHYRQANDPKIYTPK